MNIGIKAAKGNIIIRLDAHANYEKDYFSVLSRRLIELGADNVGVVCKTDVLNKTPKTLAIREVLGNKWGVGNSAFVSALIRCRRWTLCHLDAGAEKCLRNMVCMMSV